MSWQDAREDAPAPGHWRVMAQPMAAAPAGPNAATGLEADVPARSGGHPLIATLVCAGVLGLSLAGQGTTPTDSRGGWSEGLGFILGGALFGVILWAIAYAITIRKASKRWKLGSLAVLAVLGSLVSLNDMMREGGGAGPSQPPPIVRTGK